MSIDLVRKVSCQDNLLLSLFVLLLERVESWKVRRGLLLGQAHARGGQLWPTSFPQVRRSGSHGKSGCGFYMATPPLEG